VQHSHTHVDKPIQVAPCTGTLSVSALAQEPEQTTSTTASVPTTISPAITLIPSESATVSAITTPAASMQYENKESSNDTPVQVESPVVKQEVEEVQEKKEVEEVQEKKEVEEVQEKQEKKEEEVVTLKEFAKTVQVVPIKLGRKKKSAEVVPKKEDNI
jgi:hypothetical protein